MRNRIQTDKSLGDWADDMQMAADAAARSGNMEMAAGNAALANRLREAQRTEAALLTLKTVLDGMRKIIPGGEDGGATLAQLLRRVVDDLGECRSLLTTLQWSGDGGHGTACCPFCDQDSLAGHTKACALDAVLP